jgi:predicted amidohydrolase YtcJ
VTYDPRMSSDPVVVFVADRFHTMEPDQPTVEAVAVRDGRIVSLGTLASVVDGLGDTPYVIDEQLRGTVVLPGLIDQHLHPLLGASTLATEVISMEEWHLPDVTFPAAHSPEQYLARLRAAEAAMTDPDEWLFTWGYHELWHGPLDRAILDSVSATRPIGVWQRSCHEWFMNSAGIERLGITAESLAGKGPSSDQVDVAAGHFWEGGFFNLVMPEVAQYFLTRERLTRGLHQLVAYLHRNGVTAFNEPGIIWEMEPWDLYQEILGAADVPFTSTFMVDGRTQAAKRMSPDEALADARQQVAKASSGKVSMLDGHVKLFADGAIISQLMQMRDGYLDAAGRLDPEHRGEWLMQPDELARFYRAYWDAGWQIHTHVNGDLGLDVVLDALQQCAADNPRDDHRCVIVHFANSTEEQVDRIAALGAIVSANPYYPCGFADKYGEIGLGPDRADVMVRSKSVLDRHIPLSFHSDLPMAPAEPLRLAAFAVNRRTESGRVAAPEQRISVDSALRAVTIEAAYSWRREHEIGSIAPGKLATFTVLAADPYLVDPDDLGDIPVVGIVSEGTWMPVPERSSSASDQIDADSSLAIHRLAVGHDHHDHHGCGCDAARHLAHAYRSVVAPAA